YLGQIVEEADGERLFADPRHPYTRALLDAVPSLDPAVRRFAQRVPLAGDVPSPARPPAGCRFHTRCPLVFERCRREEPPLVPVAGGVSRCFLAEPGGGPRSA